MKRKVVLFVLALAIVVFGAAAGIAVEYGSSNEKPGVSAGTQAIEARLRKIESDVAEMRKDMERIVELNKRLQAAVTELQRHVLAVTTFKDEDAWKTVHGNMTSEDVNELMGPPDRITRPDRVSEIWYYFGLGSVTFDRRGRIMEQSSFEERPEEYRRSR